MTFIRGNQATDQTRTDCAQATDRNIDKVEDPATKVPDIEAQATIASDIEAQATKASDVEAINIESQAKSESDLDDSDFVFIATEEEER
ncbi:hypothetical protein [Endozoicomonas atrinae]|uniref:hypothetical protein n=1 Tax=Endozoicomonas atrinae TaxID=1333660 RepID=UPI0008245141|nr:hypothetical protein [Endozoicomonas atrinae]